MANDRGHWVIRLHYIVQSIHTAEPACRYSITVVQHRRWLHRHFQNKYQYLEGKLQLTQLTARGCDDQYRHQSPVLLLQYAKRVWDITEGSDDEIIDAAIAKTRAFFESLGLPTRLSAYDIGEDGITAILKQLEEHGMVALGERHEVTLAESRKVLEAAR